MSKKSHGGGTNIQGPQRGKLLITGGKIFVENPGGKNAKSGAQKLKGKGVCPFPVSPKNTPPGRERPQKRPQ